MPCVAGHPAGDLGFTHATVRRVRVAREARAHQLRVGRLRDGVRRGQGRDVRRGDSARPRPRPRDPIAGVRDDPGGEFGGHGSRVTPWADAAHGPTCRRVSASRSQPLASTSRRVASSEHGHHHRSRVPRAVGRRGLAARRRPGRSPSSAPAISPPGARLFAAIAELARGREPSSRTSTVTYPYRPRDADHPLRRRAHGEGRRARPADLRGANRLED